DGPLAQPQGRGRAAADPDPGRQGPARGDGDPAGHAAGAGLHPRRRDPQAQGSDEGVDQPRHENLRPEPVRALPGRRDLLRGRAALRRLRQRGAPAHQAVAGRRRAHAVAGAGRRRGGGSHLTRARSGSRQPAAAVPPEEWEGGRPVGRSFFMGHSRLPGHLRTFYLTQATMVGRSAHMEIPMAFTLPKLPYAYEALEPHIDARTMEIHHTKHHQAYINNANAALEGSDLADKSIEHVLTNLDKLPAGKKQAVINNGGGHANHSLFWTVLSPD